MPHPKSSNASVPWQRVTLERIGPVEATVGMISLPLPKLPANGLRIDHAPSDSITVGWWRRGQRPRRVIAYLLADDGLPAIVKLTQAAAPSAPAAAAWTVESRTTLEHVDAPKHNVDNTPALRSIPADQCLTVESEITLTYAGRTLRLQACATGHRGEGVYNWHDVQIDPLWENQVAQAVRIGGIIYNGDTYLRVDVYLVLFANGVADIAAHFVNTKLHIEGNEYHGLPMIRLAGDGLQPIDAIVPADGLRHQLGDVAINLADCAVLSSIKRPGRIINGGDFVLWCPFSRTSFPLIEDAQAVEWFAGFARTVRMQLSLSDAPPVIARYRAPNWWYALCDELWPGQYLPVRGGAENLGEATADNIRMHMARGRFHAGFAYKGGNDGDSGIGLLQNYYLTGRPELLEDALVYCYFWADLMVDHTDFTSHQTRGGWPWKTCAYCKFRDVLMGYLETGDPYLLDLTEMCAESYWQWFRANWPRDAIGRDAFSVAAWALMWRFLDTQHARERCAEFVRMLQTVLDANGTVGGQMGVGPHPGYHSSLYMTGVAMISVLEVCQAMEQMTETPKITELVNMLQVMGKHFLRTDVELFPSSYGRPWDCKATIVWKSLACRIFPESARLQGFEDEATHQGLDRCYDRSAQNLNKWADRGRSGMQMMHPHYYEALLVGARWCGAGVRLKPIRMQRHWPDHQMIATPRGQLMITIKPGTHSHTTFSFDASEEFPVEVACGDQVKKTTSKGSITLRLSDTPQS